MEDKMANVPYYVYETEQARHERTVKRFIITIIISVILLFASNAVWLYAWMQYDYGYEESYTQDGEGTNIIGDGNGVTNGADISP